MANPLERMVGPLPVGGWLLAIGGGIGLALYINRGRDGGSEVIKVPVPAIGNEGGGIAIGGGAPSPPPFDTPDQSRTNLDWINDGVTALQAEGVSPVAAFAALSDFVAGRPLTSDQRGLVDQAIGLVGPPPNPPAFIPDEIDPVEQLPSTNREWLRRAVRVVIEASGPNPPPGRDPLTITNDLTDYIMQRHLSRRRVQSAAAEAIKVLGPLPEGFRVL